MNAELDRLPEMLARLGLKAMRDRLDNLLDEAGRRDLSLREALSLVCAAEVARPPAHAGPPRAGTAAGHEGASAVASSRRNRSIGGSPVVPWMR